MVKAADLSSATVHSWREKPCFVMSPGFEPLPCQAFFFPSSFPLSLNPSPTLEEVSGVLLFGDPLTITSKWEIVHFFCPLEPDPKDYGPGGVFQ